MWKLLTSRLAGPVGLGLSLLLAIALLSLLLVKNSEISQLRKDLKTEKDSNLVLKLDNQTLRGNALGLEAGLNACNAGVDRAAAQATAIANAGAAALEQVQKAGKTVDAKARAIDAMPKETCEDALKILKSN